MILIQKVANYDEIQAMADQNAQLNIYELIENTVHERIFDPCTIEKPGWLDKLTGKAQLPSHYYISPNHFPIIMEMDVSHQDTHGPLGVTLELDVAMDLAHSDSGKGLADWLERHGNIVDDGMMNTFVQEKLTKGFLENTLGLKYKPFNELAGGTMHLGAEAFREVFPHWLVVEECRVSNAVVKMTQTEIMREQHAKRLAEMKRQLAERLAEQDKKNAEIQAAIEYQKLANELAKLKAEGESIENQKRMAMLRTACDSIHGERRLNTISGEPFIAERLVLMINNVQLELESKRDVILGRTRTTADVSMVIPEGCMDAEKRRVLCGNISKQHVRLEHLGGAVRIMSMPRTPSKENLTTMTSTYLGKEKVLLEGKVFTDDAELGVSSDVQWKCRVQKEMNDAGVDKIAAIVLHYPACNELYKVFVWPNCSLKAVDPRLPNWRIAYQAGAHGSAGAFYVTTASGKSMYLNPQLSILDDVALRVMPD